MAARAVSFLVILLTACQAPPPHAADSVAMTDTSVPTGSELPGSASPGSDSSAAPAPSGTEVVLRTDKSIYRAGGKITLTLVNGTGNRYAYNPCARIIEHESGGRWTEVREDRICTMIAWILERRSSRSGDTELPDAIEPGRYRIVVSLTEEESGPPARAMRVESMPINITGGN